MSVSVTVPSVSRTAANADALHAKIAIRNLDFFYGENRALKNINCSLTRAR